MSNWFCSQYNSPLPPPHRMGYRSSKLLRYKYLHTAIEVGSYPQQAKQQIHVRCGSGWKADFGSGTTDAISNHEPGRSRKRCRLSSANRTQRQRQQGLRLRVRRSYAPLANNVINDENNNKTHRKRRQAIWLSGLCFSSSAVHRQEHGQIRKLLLWELTKLVLSVEEGRRSSVGIRLM